jgi:hypothetical protein
MTSKQLTENIREAIGGTFGRMARSYKTGYEKGSKVDLEKLSQDLFAKQTKGGHEYDIRSRKAGFGRDFEDILGARYSKGAPGETPTFSSLQRNAENFKWQSSSPEKIARFVSQKIAKDTHMGEKTLIVLWAILANFNDINKKIGSHSKEIMNVEKAIQYVAGKAETDLNDPKVVRNLEKQAKYFNAHKSLI